MVHQPNVCPSYKKHADIKEKKNQPPQPKPSNPRPSNRMTTLALAATLAALPSTPIAEANPRHTIDQVYARFNADHRSTTPKPTITGIDFDGDSDEFPHWDVYFTQAQRLKEVEVDDLDLVPAHIENLPGRPIASRLTFRQALARTRQLQRGTVTSLELERDDEKGPVWSAEIRHQGKSIELYISPTNGRLIERTIEATESQ